jgi:hypothetical protein
MFNREIIFLVISGNLQPAADFPGVLGISQLPLWKSRDPTPVAPGKSSFTGLFSAQ